VGDCYIDVAISHNIRCENHQETEIDYPEITILEPRQSGENYSCVVALYPGYAYWNRCTRALHGM